MSAPTANVMLRGSVETVTEFFGYAVNAILHQREVYPAEHFNKVTRHGVPMMITENPALKQYIVTVLKQLVDWLATGDAQCVAIVIQSKATGETVERWVFDVATSTAEAAKARGPIAPADDVAAEVQAVLKQVASSSTTLPKIQEETKFDLLVYTRRDCDVPASWQFSDPKLVQQEADQVKLRSVNTDFHKVDPSVTFPKK